MGVRDGDSHLAFIGENVNDFTPQHFTTRGHLDLRQEIALRIFLAMVSGGAKLSFNTDVPGEQQIKKACMLADAFLYVASVEKEIERSFFNRGDIP